MKRDLETLFKEFLYECEYVKRVRPETLKGYIHSFKIFRKLVPGISHDQLSTELITSFFRTLQERKRMVGNGIIKVGVKTSTIASYWSKLNVFFAWLKDNGHVATNPFQYLKYPIPSYEDKKYLRKEEIEKIFTAIHLHNSQNILVFKRNLVLLHLLLYCGLRKEELQFLQIRDIDLEKKLITIRGETSKSKRTRQLPLHSSTVMHLKDYLSERKQYTTPYLIISNLRDDKLSNAGLVHLVNSIRRRSKVSFHLHQFRHTFAVNFLKATNNIFKLKVMLGHSDIRVTSLYLRCLPPEEFRGDIESLSVDTFI